MATSWISYPYLVNQQYSLTSLKMPGKTPLLVLKHISIHSLRVHVEAGLACSLNLHKYPAVHCIFKRRPEGKLCLQSSLFCFLLSCQRIHHTVNKQVSKFFTVILPHALVRKIDSLINKLFAWTLLYCYFIIAPQSALSYFFKSFKSSIYCTCGIEYIFSH